MPSSADIVSAIQAALAEDVVAAPVAAVLGEVWVESSWSDDAIERLAAIVVPRPGEPSA